MSFDFNGQDKATTTINVTVTIFMTKKGSRPSTTKTKTNETFRFQYMMFDIEKTALNIEIAWVRWPKTNDANFI